MSDTLKRSDQIAMLATCAVFTDSGEWKPLFTYPACGWDLVQLGLVKEDKTITLAGRFALWVLDKGDDPNPASKSSVSFSLPLKD